MMRTKNYEYIELSKGVTCFEKVGDSNKPPVVLVHGLSTPMCIWDKNVDALSEYCYVIRYDLYGRGFSARPPLVYNADLFITQLYELIEKLSLKLPVNLIGLSMGGAIVSDFSVRYPNMVDKIVLIAPAGLLKRTMSVKLMSAQLIGKWIYEFLGKKALVKGVLETIGDSIEDKMYMKEIYDQQMKIPGYRESLLSTIRYGPLYDMENVYQQLGQQQRKGCLIWGDKDNVVPLSVIEKVLQLVPWFTFHKIKDGSHAVNYQKPDIVNPILCSFFTNE